jgi:hypothetical protein
MRKCASKQVLVAEPGPLVTTDKKVKPDFPVAAAAMPTRGTWCPIHETNTHDLKICHTIYDLAENRKKALHRAHHCGDHWQLLQLWPPRPHVARLP